MQSPAGYMCMILVALAIIFTPIIEKKLAKEKALRLAMLLPPMQTDIAEDAEDAEEAVSRFGAIRGRFKTFAEKLEENPIAKERYLDIYSYLFEINGIRAIEGKRTRTFKSGNVALVKFAVKGKTLNAYIALPPEEYESTKYIFTDAREFKKYENYPMRVKVSSNRQVKWVKELVSQALSKGGK